MKVIRIHEFGGPEKLRLEDAPRPKPLSGQVVIQQMAAGVNPVDWKTRAGIYPPERTVPLPWIPGVDGAGIVAETGSEAGSFQPGDAVFGPITGGYAEYVLAQAGSLQKKPVNLTFEQAGAVPVCALTAWQSVIEIANVGPGQKVLVQGAAGGIGHFAVQFAHWKGAFVIGTASANNTDFVRSLGADQVIDYHQTRFESVVHDLDAVIDTVGGDIFTRSMQVIRRGGVLATNGSWPSPEMGKEQGIRVVRGSRAPIDRFGQIAHLLETGLIKPYVGAIFSLEEAGKAQTLSQSGHLRGKIVLQVSVFPD